MAPDDMIGCCVRNVDGTMWPFGPTFNLMRAIPCCAGGALSMITAGTISVDPMYFSLVTKDKLVAPIRQNQMDTGIKMASPRTEPSQK